MELTWGLRVSLFYHVIAIAEGVEGFENVRIGAALDFESGSAEEDRLGGHRNSRAQERYSAGSRVATQSRNHKHNQPI